MKEPTVKVTLKDSLSLLKRWYLHELNDKTVRIESMRMLQAAGMLPELDRERAAMDARAAKPATHQSDDAHG